MKTFATVLFFLLATTGFAAVPDADPWNVRNIAGVTDAQAGQIRTSLARQAPRTDLDRETVFRLAAFSFKAGVAPDSIGIVIQKAAESMGKLQAAGVARHQARRMLLQRVEKSLDGKKQEQGAAVLQRICAGLSREAGTRARVTGREWNEQRREEKRYSGALGGGKNGGNNGGKP